MKMKIDALRRLRATLIRQHACRAMGWLQRCLFNVSPLATLPPGGADAGGVRCRAAIIYFLMRSLWARRRQKTFRSPPGERRRFYFHAVTAAARHDFSIRQFSASVMRHK